MSEKKDSLFLSYSSASKFKTCPEKYYLSKDYSSSLSSSAFPFGKAIETGVEALLKGETLDKALELFCNRWHTEAADKYSAEKPVFDNMDVQFYTSDYDKNVFNDDDEELIATWAKELELKINDDGHWMDLFDSIAELVKDGAKVSEQQLKFHNRVVWLSCEIRGQVMIRAFKEKLLPKLKLVKVGDNFAAQLPVDIKNDEGDTIPGFIDFVVMYEGHKDPIIADLKTAAYFYPDHALDTSEQLRTYVAAKGAEFKTRYAGYIVLVKKLLVKRRCDKCSSFQEGLAKNCKTKDCKGKYIVPELDANVQFIFKKYEEDELEDVLSDYQNVLVAIKNNVRFKNSSNCNQYGRKCEFYDHCWKRKALEELDHLKLKKALTVTDDSDTTD